MEAAAANHLNRRTLREGLENGLITGEEYMEAIRQIREDESFDITGIIAHPDTPIGIYEGDGRVRLGGRGAVSMIYDEFAPLFQASVAFRMRDFGPLMASAAYMPGLEGARFADHLQQREFRSFSKVTDEAEKKAWALLEKFMTPDQHFAFMEGSTVELENGDGKYRLLIDRTGRFRLLQGKSGAGIQVIGGIIRRYKYPLGDEIAAFLDWFNHRTEKLIAQWNCGTFSLVPDGRAR